MANNNFYGVRVNESSTVVSYETVTNGIIIAVGTAPVHQVGGEANQIVLANTWDEAEAALGWSDDWEKYTLCEVMYSQFKLYGYGPVLFVNVLDPESNTSAVENETNAISNGKVTLSGDVIADTIVVTDGDSTTYEAGTDYAVFYEDGVCYIEILEGGAIDTAALTEVTVSYSLVDFEAADLVDAVIGGSDASTGVRTGLELVDAAYYKERVLPDIIIAPGFSQYPEVAAVMAAKAQSFSTVFRGMAYCDLDASTITNYLDAVAAKEADENFRMEKQCVFWPMVKNGDRLFHLSTQMAGRTTATDSDNDGVPSESPSNKTLQADAACLADGTEILIDLTQANYLRGNGICTALNFVNGLTGWGSYTACYPDSSETKDIYINVARMMTYICNQIILRCWSKIDRNMTTRIPSAIVDEINIWLNSLTGDGHLLGGRCELNASENSQEDMRMGIIRLHVYACPCTPVQEIDFTVEYDASYAEDAYVIE